MAFGMSCYCQNSKEYFESGLEKIKAQNYQAALTDFTKAIEMNSTFGDAFFYRGNVKIQLKDYQGAIKDYDMAIELDSANSLA